MNLPDNIFRNYDIRGIYPKEINEDIALNIGRSVGTFFLQNKVQNIVVGRDNRVSSPSISKNFLAGVISTGCNATFINNTITPIIHFLTCTQNFEGGVMITASHNPAEYTGFRLDFKNANPIYGKDILKIEQLAESETFATGNGLLLEQDLAYLYEEYLKTRFGKLGNFRIALDTGNGSASDLAPKIFESLGCTVEKFNSDLAGGFALGIADPENPLMMERLSQEVLTSKVSVGFAFDEDADRFGAVDEQGVAHSSDKLLMLFAEHELANKKGTVIFDVKSSQILFEIIENSGGNAKLMKTGHPYFLQAMSQGAMLGAEFSGHFYFSDGYYGFDDGIYAACKVLEIMNKNDKPLSKLMDKFPKTYHTTELKLACDDELKYSLLEKITEVIETMQKNYKSFIAVDGLRVNITDTGWFLIRASNTTPFLSVRVEGRTLSEAKLMLERLEQMLSPFGLLDLSPLKTPKIYYS
jgi:phosphomannomutase/phosphoglucomutase